MARWITVRQKFDYRWPDRSAMTHYGDAELGDQFVKDEIADFAIEKGYATEGKLDDASRSKKSGPKRVRRARKGAAAATTANMGAGLRVGDADVPDDDRADDRAAVDHDAG